MKTKRTLILILILYFAAVSCVTERRCNRKYPPQVSTHTRDTIITERHDTTVFVQYQSDTTQAAQPTYKPSFLSNKYCTSAAWVRSDTLYHNLITTAQSVPVTFRDVIRKNTKVQFHTVWMTKEVRYTPMFTRVLAWIGGVSVLMLAVWVAWKLLK